MVQRKAPDKRDAPVEPKTNHAKPDKRLYSHHQQDGRGGGAGELRRMLKKSRSIKVLEESLDSPLEDQLVKLGKPPATTKKKKKRPSSVVAEPNYMKSTSSSNARKEQLAAQVISNAPPSKAAAAAADRNHRRIAGNSYKPSDHPKSSSSGGATSPKPSKLLARKSSLRPVRPAMKKSSGVPLCPTINASRATCSSTMKETSFPDHLDLNHGGTDAEGTSVLKVCPYTYCSLNGHHHAPLPPLKCFLSARRRMLKSQKSMKLMKGLLSLRRTGPEERDDMEIGTGGAELPGVSPVAEDLGDGFFLEIYAKRREDTSSPPTISGDDVLPLLHPEDAADGTPPSSDGDDGETGEDDSRSLIDDSGTEINWDDGNFDESSDFSPSEMEVLIEFLEYVECDAEGALYPTHEGDDYADWSYADCCIKTDDARGIGDEGIYEPVPDAADTHWGEQDDFYIDFDEIDCPELAEDEPNDGLPFEIDAEGCSEDPVEAISSLPDEEDAEGTVAAERSSGEDDLSRLVEVTVDEELGQGDESGNPSEEATQEDTISSSEVDQKDMLDEEEEQVCLGEEDQTVVSNTGTHCDPFSGDDRDMEENRDAQDEETEMCAEIPPSQSDSTALPAADGTDEGVDDEIEQEIAIAETEEEDHEEVEGDQGEASSTETETWKSEKGDESQLFDEVPVEDGIDFGTSDVCADAPIGCTEGDELAITSAVASLQEEPTEASNNPRARAVITRKKVGRDEEEEPSAFNPRPPNFLPVEPDPAAEKVDLRHQLMDERKNSEEWMVDYALRRTVDKLAPGRKRKVALLVEAFETVTPMPPYGSTLGHSTVGFAHVRPIQACS